MTRYQRKESNLHSAGFESAASADWATLACAVRSERIELSSSCLWDRCHHQMTSPAWSSGGGIRTPVSRTKAARLSTGRPRHGRCGRSRTVTVGRMRPTLRRGSQRIAERRPGIAPGSREWRSRVLLLNHGRVVRAVRGTRTLHLLVTSEVPRSLGLNGTERPCRESNPAHPASEASACIRQDKGLASRRPSRESCPQAESRRGAPRRGRAASSPRGSQAREARLASLAGIEPAFPA
jgi:hypothetical protein